MLCTTELDAHQDNMATLTNEAKTFESDTWDEATYTWEDAGSRTWENQTALANEAKPANASLTNEAQS